MQFAPAVATHGDQRGDCRAVVGVAAPKMYEEFINDRRPQMNQGRGRLTGQEAFADVLAG